LLNASSNANSGKYILATIEARANEILNLPAPAIKTTSRNLQKAAKQAMERRERDSKKILEQINFIKGIIDKAEPNFLQALFFQLGILVQRADIRLIESYFEMGKQNIDGGKIGGAKSGEARREKGKPIYEKWQAEAERIWRKNWNLSKNAVVKKVSESIGGKERTICNHIEKPLL